MSKSLADISAALRDIDFCMLVSRAEDGSLGGRPMRNNRGAAFDGTSWFYADERYRSVADIERDPAVGLSYHGSAGLMGGAGRPGLFVHIEGRANLVRDRGALAEHWDTGLDRWFPQGADTPGLVLIEVRAQRVHYWDGTDEGEGEVELTATAAA
ncbi:MAG: pyridoxamine 5'-phosphate oxidase family protein [Croceibacterium sp.]